MQDLKRVSGLAIVLLVVVRISIGWQFLYEGLWKHDRLLTAKPWTSAGYLRNAQGPFRDTFRNMTGDFSEMPDPDKFGWFEGVFHTVTGDLFLGPLPDPDELGWLDYDKVARHWDEWHERFLLHHPDLTAGQKQRIEESLNGKKMFVADLEELPASVKFEKEVAKAVSYDAEKNRLVTPGKQHITPREKQKLLDMAPVMEEPPAAQAAQNEINKAFHDAVDKLYARSARLSFKERLAVSLKADPDRVKRIFRGRDWRGEIVEDTRIGEIEKYKVLLERYEKNLAKAEQQFQHEHLRKQWGELQQLRAELVGPVKALDTDLRTQARELLTAEQVAAGPVPKGPSLTSRSDAMALYSLLILGALLILGLLTRPAAIAGAGMLLSFYLVWPPFSGVPVAPGPEHSFLINKNLIELFALLAIAAMPTGSWFGLDGLFARCCRCCRKKKSGGSK